MKPGGNVLPARFLLRIESAQCSNYPKSLNGTIICGWSVSSAGIRFFSVHTGITVKEPSDWQTTVRLSGHICIHTETHACMCRGVYEMHMHVLACAMCTGVCTWVHAHMWVCVHVNMYIFVCTPTCVLYMDRFIFVWAYEYARTDRHACLYVSGYASACVCTWA